jgi:hypothetical protein
VKVVLHIGIHKTASTLFQNELFSQIDNSLFLNRPMAEPFKNYILYADDFEFTPTTAYEIFQGILKKQFIKREFSQVIISDEEFYGNPFLGAVDRKRIMDRLIATFGENMKILMLLRNQVGLLASLYNQYVKTGGTASLDRFLTYKKYPLVVSENYFLYDKYINYLYENIQSKSIKVLLYENFLENKEEFIGTITEFLCSEKGKIQVRLNKTVNHSLPHGAIPFLRQINKLTKTPKEPFLLLNNKIHKIILKLIVRFNIGGDTSYPYLNSNHEFFSKIRSSNEALDKFFPSLGIGGKDYPLKDPKRE